MRVDMVSVLLSFAEPVLNLVGRVHDDDEVVRGRSLEV